MKRNNLASAFIRLGSLMFSLLGCSGPRDGDQFIGIWSNEPEGGKLIFEINRQGELFLIQEKFAPTRQPLKTYSARVKDNVLHVDDTAVFAKIVYVEAQNKLVILGDQMAGFHRISEKR